MFAPRTASSNKINNSNTHLVRSAMEELKQQKKSSKKVQPLGDKNTNKNNENNINNNKKSTATTKPGLQTSNNKNDFSLYYFYLDNIDTQDKNRLTGRIKLLGGHIEPFFSKKCTHVITSKHGITDNNKHSNDDDDNRAIDQENIPPFNNSNSNSNKQKNSDATRVNQDIVDKAKKLDIQVWDFKKAFDMMGGYIHNPSSKKKQMEKKVLGDVYHDDKLFGPSTSTSTSTKDNVRRLQFIKFTGHYLAVEDATNVHRPPILKQYSTKILDKNCRQLPWPCLRNTPDNRSPFDKMYKKEPEKHAKKEQDGKHETVTNQRDDVACPTNTIHSTNNNTNNNTTAILKNDNNNNDNNNADALPTATTARETSATPCTPGGAMESQLRASGFQPSMPNTQSTSYCSQPKTFEINRGKRMLENLSKKVPKLSLQQEKEYQKQKDIKLELRKTQQHQEKEHDGFYCENCHERFSHFKEHIKSETHQAFIKDENNFKELDSLLAMTQRPLKKQDNGKKRPNEFALDMTDIQAPYNKMLKQSPNMHDPIHIENDHSQQENWAKYHHVFL